MILVSKNSVVENCKAAVSVFRINNNRCIDISCQRAEMKSDLVGFYGVLTIVGYLISNPFYAYKQFYFKQFSLAQVQFFVYTQLNVKTVLFQTIQFSTSTVFCLHTVKCKNSSISNNSV